MCIITLLTLFKGALIEWNKDNVSLLAAALAYYGLFSLVPLIVVLLIMLNSLFGYGVLADSVIYHALDLAGQQMPSHVGDMVNNARNQAASFQFTLMSVIVLVFCATGLFVQTKRAFHIIWSQENDKKPKVLTALMSYVQSFLLIPVVAFLLLLSSFVNVVFLFFSRYVEELLPVHFGLFRLATFLTSSLFVILLLAVTYKTLSDVKLSWGDVLLASTVTSILLNVCNFAIEVYISHSDIGTAYGAAGSFLVVVFWIYYSAQIFLFGAEIIKVHRRIMKPDN
jgi:membrane protein